MLYNLKISMVLECMHCVAIQICYPPPRFARRACLGFQLCCPTFDYAITHFGPNIVYRAYSDPDGQPADPTAEIHATPGPQMEPPGPPQDPSKT